MKGKVMNQAPAHAATDMDPTAPLRLEPMLIRLPPVLADQLRRLARATRVRQSDYLREAVADLLAKYEHVISTEDRA
jgi:hypothetical protein